MNPMLNIAIRAARKAGNVIAKNYERRDDIQTSKKGINDYVGKARLGKVLVSMLFHQDGVPP